MNFANFEYLLKCYIAEEPLVVPSQLRNFRMALLIIGRPIIQLNNQQNLEFIFQITIPENPRCQHSSMSLNHINQIKIFKRTQTILATKYMTFAAAFLALFDIFP